MTFSVAITTYNRPSNLETLVGQVQACTTIPNAILVIDSSDQINETMRTRKDITYLRSSHKNQPYQRYLAYLACTTDIIIFLDDDLEIIDFSVFDAMMAELEKAGIAGVSVGFVHHNTIQSKIEGNLNNHSVMFKLVNFISGVPILPPGGIRLAGLAGSRPTKPGRVDYFNGAVMAFYRSELIDMYDPILFSLFEEKLGMGEDKIISMRIGLKKILWYLPQSYFLHPPVASNYFVDFESFQKKTTYSRLYISIVYGRLKKIPLIFIYLHFYYFIFWRFAFSFLRWMFRPSQQNSQWLTGVAKGIIFSFTKTFGMNSSGIDWQKDAAQDIS